MRVDVCISIILLGLFLLYGTLAYFAYRLRKEEENTLEINNPKTIPSSWVTTYPCSTTNAPLSTTWTYTWMTPEPNPKKQRIRKRMIRRRKV